jgi:hypothetical protein
MLSLLFSIQAFAIPQQFTQQGRLIDNTGIPVSGTHILTFHLYESPISTTPLWGESLSVFFENGYYNTSLGSDNNNPIDTDVLDEIVLYLEIQVDSDSPLQPRQKLTSTPYARRSDVATNVEGGTVNATEISINGSVVLDASGSFIGQSSPEWSSIQNIPSGFSDGVDNDSDSLANISCPSDDMILSYTGGTWTCGYDDVLDSADIIATVEGESDLTVNLSVDSLVGGESIQTGNDQDSLGNLNCVGGEIPVLDTTNAIWVCGTDADTTLTESEVISIIQSSSSLTLALSSSTTLNGENILTETSSVDWDQLTNKPSGLDDGDDDSDSLDALNCVDGQIAIKQNGSWNCTEFSTLLDGDGDGALQWSDCDDTDPSVGDSSTDADCDGVPTGQDCDDTDDTNTTNNIGDGDCDGVATADDCDDSNANITNNGTGTSENCAATSCKTILDEGYSTGDGSYWLNYNGSTGSFFCDMTTDGGGWTRFVKYRDSVDVGNVDTDISTHLSSEGYKIGLDDTIFSYSEILLNGCGTNQQFSILVNIPDFIQSEWVEVSSNIGVSGSNTLNSCNRTVERKEGGTWFYGHNNGGGGAEFETMFFATQCVSNGVDSWSYTQWGAVDSGNAQRSSWGSTNGIDNSRNNSSSYYNDFMCAFVR